MARMFHFGICLWLVLIFVSACASGGSGDDVDNPTDGDITDDDDDNPTDDDDDSDGDNPTDDDDDGPVSIDWCALISPLQTTVVPNGSSAEILGQVQSAGVTASGEASGSIMARVAFGPAGTTLETDPVSWIKTGAVYDPNFTDPQKDQYKVRLNAGQSGEYLYFFQFSGDGGMTWSNCDKDPGTTDGFSYDDVGHMTVAYAEIESCRLDRPASSVAVSGVDSETIYGRVYVPNFTPGVGQGEQVQGQLGFGPAGTDPSSDDSHWTWSAATHNPNVTGDEDEYQAKIPGQTAGEYLYAYRFSTDGNNWVLCDIGEGSSNGFSAEDAGHLTVQDLTIDNCTLDRPELLSVEAGDNVGEIYGTVQVNGLTAGSGPRELLHMQVGFGEGSDPTSGYQWSDAVYNRDLDDDSIDEYRGGFTAPGAGNYNYVFRASLDGQTWTPCDLDGSANGFDAAQAGKLTVTDPDVVEIGWCRLSFPTTMESVVNDESIPVHGWVYIPGKTNAEGAARHVQGEVGFGPAGSQPNDEWTWFGQAEGVHYNGDTADLSGMENQVDEWAGSLTAEETSSYDYAFRFKYESPDYSTDWVLCDTDGSDNGYQTAMAGDWTVVEEPSPMPNSCRLLVSDTNAKPNESVTFTASVYAVGVTQGAGHGANIEAHFGAGMAGVSPDQWAWVIANYDSDQDGLGSNSDDVYSLTTSFPTEGTRRYAYRFRLDGGPWLYCDASGSDDGFSQDQYGTARIAWPVVDWCQTHWPSSTSSYVDQDSESIFAWIYKEGVTDTTGQGANIEVQLGYGADAANMASWTSWSDAGYNTDAGDYSSIANDEYMASLNVAQTGEYKYAFRARVTGSDLWTYCDLDGLHPGEDFGQAGSLSVTEEPASRIDWCRMNDPLSVVVAQGVQTPALQAEVFHEGLTPGDGAGTGIVAELGYGTWGADPRNWNADNWQAVAYSAEAEGGQNELYEAALRIAQAGTYGATIRVKVNDGDWRYCDGTGSDDGYQAAQSVKITVTDPIIDDCMLVGPTEAELVLGNAMPAVAAKVFEAGTTEEAGQGAPIYAQFGFGPINADPQLSSSSFTWTDAAYDSDQGEMDQYTYTHTPEAEGRYRYTFRFSTDQTSWTYCDTDGQWNGFSAADIGEATVTPDDADIEWCNTQWPAKLEATINQDSAWVYGRLYVPGVTDQVGEGSGVLAQVGYGAQDETPVNWTTWTDAVYNTDVANDFGSFANDEYRARLNASAPGLHRFAFRFSVDDGATWKYCDMVTDEVHASYSNEETAQVNFYGPRVNWCRFQHPTEAMTIMHTEATEDIFGQVYQPGVTTETGHDGEIVAQFGVGPENGDPLWTPEPWLWWDASYNSGHSGDNNYEYMVSVTFPEDESDDHYVIGTRDMAYRFSVDGGASWMYCDMSGSNASDPYTAEEANTITVEYYEEEEEEGSR